MRFIKKLLSGPKALFEAKFGPIRKLLQVREDRRRIHGVKEAIQKIESAWSTRLSQRQEEESPIFLLSAGWRSGSTLLQRLICSAPNVLIWGEPYEHCDFERRLAEGLATFNSEYPPSHFFLSRRTDSQAPEDDPRGDPLTLAEEWIANLYPEPKFVRSALHEFYRALYGVPAARRGYRRWGVKRVRLGAEHASLLKWMFPAARLVLLYRNPYDAYRSYRYHRGWYDRFPDRPILTPKAFGNHWRRLAEGFVTLRNSDEAYLVLSYEELVGIDDAGIVDRISAYVREPLDHQVLSVKVGSTRSRPTASIPRFELRELRHAVDPLASALGYDGPSANDHPTDNLS